MLEAREMDALIRAARISQTKLPNEEIKIQMGTEATLIEDIIWVGHVLRMMNTIQPKWKWSWRI